MLELGGPKEEAYLGSFEREETKVRMARLESTDFLLMTTVGERCVEGRIGRCLGLPLLPWLVGPAGRRQLTVLLVVGEEEEEVTGRPRLTCVDTPFFVLIFAIVENIRVCYCFAVLFFAGKRSTL